MARIFISYRRTDSKWVAGRIYDRLGEVIDKDKLFLDVSDIEPGEDFLDRIERVVGSCQVLLAVIGHDWLRSCTASGQRRLDDPDDWVRVEIATALKRDIRVIPILVDDTQMHDESSLPEDLKKLRRRNPKIVTFHHFHSDLDSLIRVLNKVLSVPEAGQAEAIPEAEKHDAIAEEAISITELPLSICIETLGGVASPLIRKGTALPAEASQIFSTATDNQLGVETVLVWGERSKAKDNLPLGDFKLEDIEPAPKGIPQIEVTVKVDKGLLMTVTAKNKKSGKIKVLDAVDLTRVEIPEQMKSESRAPESAGSKGDPFDIFREVFGGKNNSMFDQFFGHGSATSRDINMPLDVTAVQARNGAKKEFTFKRHDACESCGGKGGIGPHTCKGCAGVGEVVSSRGFFQVKNKCPDCDGNGTTFDRLCTECNGRKTKETGHTISVQVPKGTVNGTTLRAAGHGNKVAGDNSRGDVLLKVNVK